MTYLCLTFENSHTSLGGATVSTSAHIGTKKKHTLMKHTVCGPMQTTSAEMQTKFIAVERRVKMKGHEQEEEYEYVV